MHMTTTMIAGVTPAALAGLAGLHAGYRKLTEKRRWLRRCNAPFPS